MSIQPKGSRITVEEVREAYRVTGLKPLRGFWTLSRAFDEPAASCCPAVAVAKCRATNPEQFMDAVKLAP